MATRRAGNLVDQFKAATTAPAASLSSASLSSASTLSVPGGKAKASGSVGQWLQKNWGKAAAIAIVVTITTIFIVRTALIIKAKKKKQQPSAPGAAGTGEQQVQWESFFDQRPVRGAAPRPTLPPGSFPFAPPPPPNHTQRPPPPPAAPAHPPGFMPLPPMPNPTAPPAPSTTQHQQERGLMQQRMPPADGSHPGSALTMMPESSRPVPPENATFTVTTDLPIVSGKEEDKKARSEQAETEMTLAQEVDAPSRGAEFA